ncbi:cell wall-binding repeat-containing protein [Bacillus aquiflavi]|uniref:Cell wall-binding repeat-containing protein n=1 Tax=Bacillus aquiflavi TaxID=2672567 RepID=A0A6B3VQQ4_9BACI|nr:cell wall-binding repeat-containing protein [Bacillus aquiflavi]MBA4535914.1 cell wall-binding repeat-containing protein [Bacillus aquiflavi]NEY80289.1 cell wall-binding repeat-containing protein [Bacillus aquiflavi]
MKRLVILIIHTMLILLFLCACTTNDNQYKSEQALHSKLKKTFTEPPKKINPNATSYLYTDNTKNTTRINSNTVIDEAVIVSQMMWPATHEGNQPEIVILAPVEKWQTSLSASNLIHHPYNGTLLFINETNIPEKTLQEITRLNPKGSKDGTKIILIGEVSEEVLEALSMYNYIQLFGEDPAHSAQIIDEFYAQLTDSYPENIIIVSSDNKAKLYSIPAMGWSAYMPDPILFVSKDVLPKETITALKQRKKANIYILGPEKIISKQVEEELTKYGNVVRIFGETPVTNAIQFATFKDQKTGFGWGITESSHAISFVSTKTPDLAFGAAAFSHIGKHAPIILLQEGQLTDDVYNFLADIKPIIRKDSPKQYYNHGFLFGTMNNIPHETQGIVDDKLEIYVQD